MAGFGSPRKPGSEALNANLAEHFDLTSDDPGVDVPLVDCVDQLWPMAAPRNVLEPGAIVAVFTLGTWINRRKEFFGPEENRSLLHDDEADEERRGREEQEHGAEKRRRAKARGMIHSRILSLVPLSSGNMILAVDLPDVYQGARAVSAWVVAGKETVFQTAEDHAIQILSLEHQLHIDVELSVPRLILDKTPRLMDVLAYVYHSRVQRLLLHLPPTQSIPKIRRALALENAIAFAIFSLWRCKPARLLPEGYGLIDVLHKGSSGSAWTHNKFQLTIAAMPSLHCGNAVFVAFVLVMFSPHWPLHVVAPLWPMVMALTVVATANHFILDAVGVAVVVIAYRLDRVMLVLVPLERWLFRALWLEKPRVE